MQLRDIEYVIILAEEMNFSSAAARLFISQPTLSHAIKKLEQELGTQLFQRNTNYVHLTLAGELFASEGRKILYQSRQLVRQMEEISCVDKGTLVLGISTFYSSYYLAKIIPAFSALYPGIHLDIKEDFSNKLEEYVLNGSVDLSMIPLPLSHSELKYEILQQEEILLAIPPNSDLVSQLVYSPSAGLPFIDLSLAKEESFIFLQKEQRFSSMGVDICKRAGFFPKINYRLTNWDAINTLVGCGIGVGFVPEMVCNRRLLGCSTPIYCRILGENNIRPYAAVFRDDKLSSIHVQNFLAVLRTVFHQKQSDAS